MTEKEQIKAEIEGRIALAEKCAEAACEKNLHSALEANEMLIRQYKSLLAFIESLPDENNPEPYNPVYDEDYLNEKITKATKSWEGVDVNKMLADCRGYEEKPSEDLEEAAEEYASDYPAYNDEQAIAKYAFKRGAEWQEKQDLRWAGEIHKNGYNLCKEQMLKNAVEGEVENSCFGIVYLRKNLMNEGYSTGDKVKILILKDEE